MIKLNDLVTPEQRAMLTQSVLVRHRLEEQYRDIEHQDHAAKFGMWVFLSTEVMTFGALFLVLGIYRFLYPEAVMAASAKLNWKVGGGNAILLLISSFTMAAAVHFARLGRIRPMTLLLATSVFIGICFLGLKAYEYYTDYQHYLIPGWRFRPEEWIRKEGLTPAQVPHVKLFLLMYWIMTGAHVLHLCIGIALVSTIMILAMRGSFDAVYHTPVEVASIYWSFVDIVWIFLLPMLYLLGTHHQVPF